MTVRLPRVRRGRVTRIVLMVRGQRSRVIRPKRGRRAPRTVRIALPARGGRVAVRIKLQVADGRRHRVVKATRLYRACL